MFRTAVTVSRTWVLGVLVCAVGLVGCGDSKADDATDGGVDAAISDEDREALSEALFDREHLIEVEVELDDDDWETIRHEGRSLPAVFSGCAFDFEYTYVSGTVTVDGERYEDVAVRKKGYLGSLSVGRPSLKVNFGKSLDGSMANEGRTHAGMKRMTLNNDHSDPSHAHQCMAYDIFRAAGSVSSRCNFAHVVVNGEDLGIYSHIESVKKPMLRRHFDDDDGNLYEGQGGDFTEVRKPLLELKTNERENDRSDIDRVIDALEADDDALLEELGAVVNIDAFLTFWVMEVMSGHWDSYSGGRNNFLTYHDPTSDQFHFIPWGTDGAFTQTRVFDPRNTAFTLLADGIVANRLYNHPEGRQMYLDRFAELFDEVWDEDALLAQADSIGDFTDPVPGAVDAVKQSIRDQTTEIRRELGLEPVEWIESGVEETEIMCLADYPQPISGTFDTTWGSMMMPGFGARIEADIEGWDSSLAYVAADTDPDQPGTASIFFFTPQGEDRFIILALSVPQDQFVPGTHDMHGFETVGYLVDSDPMTPDDLRFIGFVGGGTVTFEQASMTFGEPVSGSFEGELAMTQAP